MTILEAPTQTLTDIDAFFYFANRDPQAKKKEEVKPVDTTVRLPFWKYVERTAGVRLDRWQLHLCNRLEKLRWQKGQRIMFHAPPQVGKPLHISSAVLMGDGTYKKLGEIEIGETVITHAGRPRAVTAIHIQGILPLLEIKTRHGRTILSAHDHPFLTPEGWVEAKDLIINQSLACVSEAKPSSADVRRDDEFELLGYFVGDGACGPAGETSIHANITSNDREQAARFCKIANNLGFQYRVFAKAKTSALTYAFRGGVRDWLRDAGIAGSKSGFKRVPAWVFQGNNRQVALFLGAYFSCDGTIGTKGIGRNGEKRKDGVIEFYSISEELLRDVQSLLLRLGIQSRVTIKNGRYLKNRHLSFRLTLSSQDMLAQFADKIPVAGAKAEKLQSIKPRRRNFSTQYLADEITSINEADAGECRCLTVEEDETFTANDLIVHNSVIVSQRLVPWLLGHTPTLRAKVACYNTERATRHTRIAKQIMNFSAHKSVFPEMDVFVNPNAPDKEWSTLARQQKYDGQPSFHALGLETGFTGDGADFLIIDDPYSKGDDARSKTINAKICNFWPETAKPRLNDDTNVIMMFHRYAEDDIAGTTLEELGWEYYRYAAIADGEYKHPVTGQKWSDPLGREVGEKLSARLSEDWYERNQKNQTVWLSQFQGRPTNKEGNYFKVGLLRPEDRIERNSIPTTCKFYCRAWDLAGTDDGGDYTVGVLWAGPDKEGTFYIVDVIRGQWGPEKVMAKIKETAGLDKMWRQNTLQLFPQDPAQAGKFQARAIVKSLAGFYAQTRPVSGDKEVRAFEFASQFNVQNCKIVRGEWNKDFLEELRAFPKGSNDDQVDAASDGFNQLNVRIEWKAS